MSCVRLSSDFTLSTDTHSLLQGVPALVCMRKFTQLQRVVSQGKTNYT